MLTSHILMAQPIIHGKTESENTVDRKRMANDIASAAQNKVIVTGLNDEVDIKTFTMSNSEHVFTGLIANDDKDVSKSYSWLRINGWCYSIVCRCHESA